MMILQGHDVEKVASMEKKEDRLLTIKEKIDNNGKSEKKRHVTKTRNINLINTNFLSLKLFNTYVLCSLYLDEKPICSLYQVRQLFYDNRRERFPQYSKGWSWI